MKRTSSKAPFRCKCLYALCIQLQDRQAVVELLARHLVHQRLYVPPRPLFFLTKAQNPNKPDAQTTATCTCDGTRWTDVTVILC